MLFIHVLISYKVGSARLVTCIVEYSKLHVHHFGRNLDWQIDNTETENSSISEHGRNEETEVQDVIDEGDEPYIYL